MHVPKQLQELQPADSNLLPLSAEADADAGKQVLPQTHVACMVLHGGQHVLAAAG